MLAFIWFTVTIFIAELVSNLKIKNFRSDSLLLASVPWKTVSQPDIGDDGYISLEFNTEGDHFDYTKPMQMPSTADQVPCIAYSCWFGGGPSMTMARPLVWCSTCIGSIQQPLTSRLLHQLQRAHVHRSSMSTPAYRSPLISTRSRSILHQYTRFTGVTELLPIIHI